MSGFQERGPAPKREAERERRNEPAVEKEQIDVTKLIARDVEIPAANPDWHEIARNWYDSLKESAQSVYFEPSDWAMAQLTAHNIDLLLKPQVIAYDEEDKKLVRAVRPMKGADMAAILKSSTNLLMTEVDRRRAGIEVQRAIQLGDEEEQGEGNVVDFETARDAAIGN